MKVSLALPRHGDERAVLVNEAGGACLECLRVLLRPPVLEVAVRVVVAALVVESVGQLVADDNPDVAVIGSVVFLHGKVRRLEDAGWDVDFVHLRVVRRVVGRRCRAPLAGSTAFPIWRAGA